MVSEDQDQSLLTKTGKLRDDLLAAAAKLAVYAEALSGEAERLRRLADESASEAERVAAEKLADDLAGPAGG